MLAGIFLWPTYFYFLIALADLFSHCIFFGYLKLLSPILIEILANEFPESYHLFINSVMILTLNSLP